MVFRDRRFPVKQRDPGGYPFQQITCGQPFLRRGRSERANDPLGERAFRCRFSAGGDGGEHGHGFLPAHRPRGAQFQPGSHCRRIRYQGIRKGFQQRGD